MILYHGSTEVIQKPAILFQGGSRDFGKGFYCTDIRSQAGKWALRQGRIRKQAAIINIFDFNTDDAQCKIKYKAFNDYSAEWLELILKCRTEQSEHQL
jgi:hypothetical protein